IVLPVHNEERDLETSVRRLRDVLSREQTFRARIVIAENGSTDTTPAIALRLTQELRGVMLLRLAQPGRGRALRTAWLQSSADVVAYMDVDLSTDLAALPALIHAVADGGAGIAIGSRLVDGAHVRRSLRREVISRCYNRIVRRRLGLRLRDAQCGFKAMRADIARALLPRVADDGWFFDTELLHRAQQDGVAVAELPVTWTEDPRSSVKVVRTARDDLRGIRRLRAEIAPVRSLRREVLRFCAIGILSTAAYLGIFEALEGVVGGAAANVVGLGITAVANTAANRRFTWGVRGAAGWLQAQLGGVVTFVLALLATSGALLILHTQDPSASDVVELAVLGVASVTGTALRFLVLRNWIARPHRHATA
ncbi:MAG: glycosyltransferase, partial [Candidatus Dormibacteraeota bacterium]|nr:glycosyltransferase [Candidatus Dormibacteraeota bacterium]